MKKKEIFRFHYHFVINKKIIIITIITFVILMISNIYEIINIDRKLSIEEANLNYFLVSSVYYKIVLIFITVYLFSMSMLPRVDFSVYFLLVRNVTKKTSFIFKEIIMTCFTLFIGINFFISFSYLGLLLPFFEMSSDYYFYFIKVIILGIIYGLLSQMLMQIINTSFSIIISLVIFIFSSKIITSKDLGSLEKILLLVIPNISSDGNYLFNGHFIDILYLILYTVLLVNINLYIYLNRDLNY